jgi:hypothetical protein
MSDEGIDTCLDAYASEEIGEDKPYRWWWNGCDVLATAIASLARHVRVDGCHLLDDAEKAQLETLERYMSAFSEKPSSLFAAGEETWLHAEATWLLGQWFARLWLQLEG